MKKIIALFSCVISILFTILPIQAASLDSFAHRDMGSKEEIHILSDGNGRLEINGETYEVSKENPLDLVIEGNLNENLTVTAFGKDEALVAMWGVFEDSDSYSVLNGFESSSVNSFVFGETRMMQISFASQEEIDAFYGGVSNTRRRARSNTATSLFEKNVGYSFSGRLTISNEDIYADTFSVDYVDGELSQIADEFLQEQIRLHCLNPGDIAPTKNISVYGMYAPIYHTYHATIVKIEQNKLWIELVTDRLKTPSGYELKGYNNGQTVGYQRVGRTEQYGGLISIEIPYGTAVIEKKDTQQNTLQGAHFVVSKDGNVVEEWDTTAEPKELALEPGTYTIEETIAPKGYIQAKPRQFTVSGGQETYFTVTDGRVGVVKRNQITDEILTGASFEVKDQTGSVIDSWISSEEVHYVNHLVEGETYTLIETKSPNGFERMDPIDFEAKCDEDIIIQAYNLPKKICASVIKIDQYFQTIRLSGAEFTLYRSDGTVAQTIDGKEAVGLTDENGEVTFEVYWNPKDTGYYLMETKAPEGYLNNHEGERIEIEHSIEILNTTQTVTVTDRANTKIQLRKTDLQTGHVQGDASLAGAKYVIYDAETNEKISKYGLEDTLVVDESGYSNVIRYLPYNKDYYAIESEAPNGYVINEEKIPLTLSLNPDGQETYLLKHTTDEVVHGKLKIYKHFNKGTGSQIDNLAEEGAVFCVMLQRYVDTYGSVEEALKHTDEMTDMEFDIMTTDQNGYAVSRSLAFGTYIVEQISALDPESILCSETYTFVIEGKNHNPTKTVSFTNERKEYALVIEKRNAETGKKITLNGAVFKIKQLEDAAGKKTNIYITQKIGNHTYDTFRTNAINTAQGTKAYFSGSDLKGTITTPLNVPAGVYQIEEISAPDGFTIAEPVVITVKASEVSEIAKDGTYIKTVAVKDEKAYGRLEFEKQFHHTEADYSFVNYEDFTGIQYQLIAKENILDPENGDVLVRRGEVFTTFSLEEDGTQVVENIPLGKYELQECAIREGILCNPNGQEVWFQQTDSETKIYSIKVQDTDEVTKVSFMKVDEDGKPLSGAKMVVKNQNGEALVSFVSTDQPYIVTGLHTKEQYILEETEAPQGYMTSDPIVFTLSDTDEMHTITMVDQQFYQVQTGYRSHLPFYFSMVFLTIAASVFSLRQLIR